MPTTPANTYSLNCLQPAQANRYAQRASVRIQPGLTNLPIGTVLAETTLTQNAVDTLAANGATAGTFRLSFRGQTTTILNYNDTAATVVAALNALQTVGAAGVVGSGTAVNGAGLVLTWSGANYTNLPIELPTITIVTAFVTAQPSIVATTIGSSLGFYGPYLNGAGSGLGIAKCLLEYACSTDNAGNITFGTAPTGEEFGQTRLTAPVYISGTFRIEDIPLTTITGITGGFMDVAPLTTQAPTMGRIIQGSIAGGVGLIVLS